jgi:hypothetical protein
MEMMCFSANQLPTISCRLKVAAKTGTSQDSVAWAMEPCLGAKRVERPKIRGTTCPTGRVFRGS